MNKTNKTTPSPWGRAGVGLRLVILDDDPTGIQTVKGCLLVTQWDDDTIREAMTDAEPFFYVLTNTRAMTRQDAARVVREAMEAVVRVNEALGYQLIFISRSDSCLRGHFPLETDVMSDVLHEHAIPEWNKKVFCPAFIEAGRYTIDGTHYMKDGDRLIPVSETEFARDNVFAYKNSVLTEYIREKGCNPDDYIIVDARSYAELDAFSAQFLNEMQQFGGSAVIRCSSSLPKSMSDSLRKVMPEVQDNKNHSSFGGEERGRSAGLFIVGSHVQKTTRQLEQLLQCDGVSGIELPIEPILDDPEPLFAETIAQMRELHDAGLTPVVYTARKEVRIDDADKRQKLGQTVSDFLVRLVREMPFTPSFLVAKGGITSHDILTHGLGIRSARVLGQILPGVPGIMTEAFPYIIFPGNVGEVTALKEAFLKLKD